MSKSASRISSSFRESLNNQLAPLVRHIRESIAAKRVPHKVVKVQVGNDKVSLDLTENQLRVVINTRKKKTQITEPELPRLFTKHVKFYVSNMGWTLDTIKSTHLDNGGEFFSVNRDLLENSLLCGWRAVTFIVKVGSSHSIYVFHPSYYGLIEYVDSRANEEEARRLSEYLAYGECFGCNMKQGPKNFCFRHDHVK
jgi:hypothetical protein